MATYSHTWTEDQTLRSAATLAAGASDTGNKVDVATDGSFGVVIWMDVTIGSSTGVTVKAMGSVDSGTTDTDDPLYKRTVDANTKWMFIIIGIPHVNIHIINDDGSNATGNIACKYAYWKGTDG